MLMIARLSSQYRVFHAHGYERLSTNCFYVASHRRNVQPTLEPAALRSAIKRTQL
jgi:hypothetical protein